MNQSSITSLKFPIGEFEKPLIITPTTLENWISHIEYFPSRLKKLIENLSPEELSWQYRPQGWSIKQVIHHCADSHMNSYIRFKLGLTEDVPNIKPYFEDRWAELPGGKDDDITDSFNLLVSLHKKWVRMLKSMNEEQLNRTFNHPERNTQFSLKENIGIYAWHCNHHLAHIRLAIKHKGNF